MEKYSLKYIVSKHFRSMLMNWNKFYVDIMVQMLMIVRRTPEHIEKIV